MVSRLRTGTAPERKKTWKPVKRDLTGWLARHQRLVTNASSGGVLA